MINDDFILDANGAIIIMSEDEYFNETVDLNELNGIDKITTITGFVLQKKNSFYGPEFSKLIFPKHITTIGKDFFSNIYVETVVWPDNCKTIEEYLFKGSNISLLLNIDNVEVIGDGAFCECEKLERFTLPEKVSEIPFRCFYSCSNLEKITINGKLKSIGEEAFCNCTSLESLDFIDSIETIPRKCFSGCKSLKKISIPDNIRIIEDNAFEVSGVTEVTWGKNVSIVPKGCFIYCALLKKVTNVGNVTKISNRAFYGTALNFISRMPKLNIIDDNAFEYTEIKEFRCAPTVSYIGKMAFRKCKKLKKFIWPESYNTIQAGCFADCSQLEKIEGMKLISFIGRRAFFNCQNFSADFTNAYLSYVEDDAFEGTKIIIC